MQEQTAGSTQPLAERLGLMRQVRCQATLGRALSMCYMVQKNSLGHHADIFCVQQSKWSKFGVWFGCMKPQAAVEPFPPERDGSSTEPLSPGCKLSHLDTLSSRGRSSHHDRSTDVHGSQPSNCRTEEHSSIQRQLQLHSVAPCAPNQPTAPLLPSEQLEEEGGVSTQQQSSPATGSGEPAVLQSQQSKKEENRDQRDIADSDDFSQVAASFRRFLSLTGEPSMTNVACWR